MANTKLTRLQANEVAKWLHEKWEHIKLHQWTLKVTAEYCSDDLMFPVTESNVRRVAKEEGLCDKWPSKNWSKTKAKTPMVYQFLAEILLGLVKGLDPRDRHHRGLLRKIRDGTITPAEITEALHIPEPEPEPESDTNHEDESEATEAEANVAEEMKGARI